MPRKPTVRYFASRNAYYTQIDGRQHRLADGPDDAPTGPTYLLALDAYKQLLTLGTVTTAKDRNSVRAVLETYLDYIQREMSPGTYALRRKSYVPFCDYQGETAVGDISHFTLDKFIGIMRTPRPHATQKGRMVAWSDTSVRMFVDGMNAAFNWAKDRKLIETNPVAKYKSKPAASRTVRCLIPPENHQRIIAAVKNEGLRCLIVALEHTGARPSELLNATAQDWNDEKGSIVYVGDDKRRVDQFRHKTAGKNENRVIFFTGEVQDMMRALIQRYPTGPLFRTRRNMGWTDVLLRRAFGRLRKQLNLPDLIPYGYRHTLATSWLESGRSIDLLARMLGNSPDVIRKRYAHINPASESIRDAIIDFRGGR